jgi:hypothetical protein
MQQTLDAKYRMLPLLWERMGPNTPICQFSLGHMFLDKVSPFSQVVVVGDHRPLTHVTFASPFIW